MPKMGTKDATYRYLSSLSLDLAEEPINGWTAGRVHLVEIAVPDAVTVDRIMTMIGGSGTGNVRFGIYKEGATAHSPDGGELVIESAAIDVSAYSRGLAAMTIAETALAAGIYFLAFQASADTVYLYTSYDVVGVLGSYYDRAGGFGAFTDPCPETAAADRAATLGLRVT